VPIVRELLGGASEQIMQIQISGTLQEPIVRKVALPALNKALQQFQDDLQKANNSPNPFPQARDWMPGARGSRQ